MSCYTLAAIIIATVIFTNTGCASESTKITWDLSKSRDLSCLSGGEWLTQSKNMYCVKRGKDGRLSILVKGDRRFDFDSTECICANIHVTDGEIDAVLFMSIFKSKQEALEFLKEKHQQGKGPGIGKTEKWIRDAEKKGSSSFNNSTTIHISKNVDDPLITADIQHGLGGEDDSWLVMTSFFWQEQGRDKEFAPERPTSGKLAWNLSKSRTIDRVSGGRWHSQSKDRYSINGDRDLRFSVILDGDRRFDFDRVRRISADRSAAKITKISITSYGYSKEKAVERLKEMHRLWNGGNVGKIDKWLTDTGKKGGSQSYNSIVCKTQNLEDPNISASLRCTDKACSISVTFYWLNPKFQKQVVEKKEVEEAPATRKLTWDLSKSLNLSQISGCKVYPLNRPTSHYIEGDQGLSVSLILGNGRHFDFGSVREVFVDQASDKINRIKIVSFKYDKQDVMDRLIEINQQGKGKEINRSDPWVPFFDTGGNGAHRAIIHRANSAEDLGIEACIVRPHYSIETSFFWEGFTQRKGELPRSRQAKAETTKESE